MRNNKPKPKPDEMEVLMVSLVWDPEDTGLQFSSAISSTITTVNALLLRLLQPNSRFAWVVKGRNTVAQCDEIKI